MGRRTSRVLSASLIALAGPASAAQAGPVLAFAPAAAATLRVGVPAGPDPVAGYDRGLFAELAREAGLGVVFEVAAPEAALAALDAGRVDVAAGPYLVDEAAERAAGRRALAPAAAGGDALLKRRGDGSLGAPDRAGGKVLGVLGPAAGPAAARLRAEAAALGGRVAAPRRAFPDPLRDLAAGRVAALVGGLVEVSAAALARPDAFEVVGPVRGRPRPLAALMRADRSDLATRLDAALGRMRADGRLADVQRRWFGFVLDPIAPSASQPASASATSKP